MRPYLRRKAFLTKKVFNRKDTAMNQKLKFTEKLGFGLGEIAGCMNSLVAAFLTMFYTDNMAMAAGAVGTMFFISKLFDGITDLIAGTIIGSLAVGPISVPVNLLTADAIDYGDYKTKVRIDGIGSSVVSFSQKLSSGLAAGAVGWILQLTGYVANEVQSATATFGITLIFAYAPIIALVVTVLILILFYHYEKVEAEVHEYLAQKGTDAK